MRLAAPSLARIIHKVGRIANPSMNSRRISNPSYSVVLLEVGDHRGIVRIHDFQFPSTAPACAVVRFQLLMPSAAVLSAFTEELPELCLVGLKCLAPAFRRTW